MSACICGLTGQSHFRKLSFDGTRPDRFSLQCPPKVLYYPSTFSLSCSLRLLALIIIVLGRDQSTKIQPCCRWPVSGRHFRRIHVLDVCAAYQRMRRGVLSLRLAQKLWSGTPSPTLMTSFHASTSEDPSPLASQLPWYWA
jgi:hypothetical protein